MYQIGIFVTNVGDAERSYQTDMFSYEDLFELIENRFGLSAEQGRESGIYSAEDMLDVSAGVERRHAAAVFHNILLKICAVKDIADISKASELLDLYDCRVCVNHIAQVYLRGIMDAAMERIFDGRALITEEEAIQAVERILKL